MSWGAGDLSAKWLKRGGIGPINRLGIAVQFSEGELSGEKEILEESSAPEESAISLKNYPRKKFRTPMGRGGGSRPSPGKKES